MLRLLILIGVNIFYINLYGQTIKIEDIPKGYRIKTPTKTFHYLNEKPDTSNYGKIATLKGSSSILGKKKITELFNSFWSKANYAGANSYIIEKISINDENDLQIEMSIYYLNKFELDIDKKLNTKNTIYVFGDIDKKKVKTKIILLNDKRTELIPYNYIEHENQVGETTTVSIGGLLGSKVWIKWKDQKESTFLSANSFNIGPYNDIDNIGLSINSGRFYPMNESFGKYLTCVLDKWIEKQKLIEPEK